MGAGLAGARPGRIGGTVNGMNAAMWVPGRARTKGSLEPTHIRMGAGRCKVSLTESGQYSKLWKDTMIVAIRQQAVCERYAGPVAVRIDVVFDRLAGDEGARFPVKREYGDIDKLARNVLDALTQSALILDDALVVTMVAGKRFVESGGQAGVHIEVKAL